MLIEQLIEQRGIIILESFELKGTKFLMIQIMDQQWLLVSYNSNQELIDKLSKKYIQTTGTFCKGKWTQQELQTLRELYPTMGSKTPLGRTQGSIKMKARSLDIKYIFTKNR